jgi:acyl carrier protein
MLSSDDELQLKELTAETLGVDVDDINDESSNLTIPAWTSFNHLTLMSAVEQSFAITLSMEEMSSIKNFGDMAVIVAKHR